MLWSMRDPTSLSRFVVPGVRLKFKSDGSLLQVQMVPVPEPGPDEVLLKLNATGLCVGISLQSSRVLLLISHRCPTSTS